MSPDVDCLRELPDARQIEGEPRRRWFTSRDLDLIVWFGPEDEPVGFQFCYDKSAREHAVTWREGRGYNHSFVDDGENGPMQPKGTPILRANGYLNRARVAELFSAAAAQIPQPLRDYVSVRLAEYPEA